MAAAQSVYITSADGLKLHARVYGPRGRRTAPVVCLPGLARTAADFEPLAEALAGERRVVALDYRGRGLSDWDPDPAKYNVMIELGDVLSVMTRLETLPAVIVGTSRGGIIAMLMAQARPDAITGAVLNDIGPVIEVAGLLRIKGYVGKLPQITTIDEGAAALRGLFAGQFPALSDADWLAYAKRTFKEDGGRFAVNYDLALAAGLAALTPETPLPAMWEQFEALARKPLMVIRGALSDVLGAETVAQMRARHGGLDYLEIAGQGHTPLLAEPNTIVRIRDFIARC